MMIELMPSVLDDLICLTASRPLSFFSMGMVIDCSMSSGATPA